MSNIGEKFERLVAIIARLRDPKSGCPWDLQQTHESLKPYLIEEAYEALDAIDAAGSSKDHRKLAEELGDVLLQVVLHSQLGADAGTFSIDSVIDSISEKLIRRHPHVFGDAKVGSAQQVTENWERLKKKESDAQGKSILSGLPRSLPALQQSHRIGEKVARVGFDWDRAQEVRDKVREELNEFLEADDAALRDSAHVREELGDMLFTVAQLSRKMGMNAEDVLREANDKFCRRFAAMERLANQDLSNLTAERLQELWEAVKNEEPAKGPKTLP